MAFRGLTSIFLACALAGTGASALAKTADNGPAIGGYGLSDRMVDPSADAIRAVLASAGHKGSFLDKRDGAAVAEYYTEQGYVPSWTVNGQFTDRARAIIKRISEADTDGLDRTDFSLPSPDLGRYVRPSASAVAQAEVMLSQAIVAYAREAYAGRLDPSTVSDNVGYERHLPDPIEVLSSVAASSEPATTLAAYNPPQEQFKKLRAMLAELRAKAATETKPPVIPEGHTLKLGVSDPRVITLRQRLNLPTDVDSPDVYDESVAGAVKTFQASVKLKTDGMAGPRTVAALNRASQDQIPLVLANMERWRWMPRDLGKFYVWVSIPDFTLTVHRDGQIIHSTRLVVGKVDHQTPIFSDKIEHVIVNPVWNVPASIAVKEMLPEIRANPAALNGYRVYANIGGRFRPVDPYMIDWQNVDMRKIQIKQPPGERNALGVVKFMFPNRFAVYLHDTPSKSLFQRDYRAYSHGCMRVMDPWSFASSLLSDEPGVSASQLRKLVGGPQQQVNLPNHVPVHITYFTAWVGDNGKLSTYADLYGYDKAIEKDLGLAS